VSAAALLLVAAGGLAGAPARYLVDRAVSDRTESDLPWGILAVNLSGSLVLGLLVGLSRAHRLGPLLLACIGTGFCGAYTTFSTFALGTTRLAEAGETALAALNLAVSLVGCLLAAAAGLAVGALL
jgi:CrcB protein